MQEVAEKQEAKRPRVPTFGAKFEKQFDLVDVVWCQFWPGTAGDDEADDALDIWFLVARSGLHEFTEFIEKYQRSKIIKKKRRNKEWSPFEESLIDGPLAERHDEGIARFILHGVRGSDSEMQFDPLATDGNTCSEGDFRSTVKATLDDQRQAGEPTFRRLVMSFADDEERFRQENLEDEAKNYARRFVGISR